MTKDTLVPRNPAAKRPADLRFEQFLAAMREFNGDGTQDLFERVFSRLVPPKRAKPRAEGVAPDRVRRNGQERARVSFERLGP